MSRLLIESIDGEMTELIEGMETGHRSAGRGEPNKPRAHRAYNASGLCDLTKGLVTAGFGAL
jgi:hypothetical protein